MSVQKHQEFPDDEFLEIPDDEFQEIPHGSENERISPVLQEMNNSSESPEQFSNYSFGPFDGDDFANTTLVDDDFVNPFDSNVSDHFDSDDFANPSGGNISDTSIVCDNFATPFGGDVSYPFGGYDSDLFDGWKSSTTPFGLME